VGRGGYNPNVGRGGSLSTLDDDLDDDWTAYLNLKPEPKPQT